MPRGGGAPWATIARELALALCPGTEPGRLASGIKEVLSARTEEEARGVLDELGFPPLDRGPPAPAPTISIGDLGGDNNVMGDAPSNPPNGARPAGAAEATGAGGSTRPAGSPTRHPVDTQRDASEGNENETGEEGDDSPRSGSGPSGGSDTKRKKEGATHPRGQIRLRTYVSPGREKPSPAGPEERKERNSVDQAGVNRVLAYERLSGRHPKEKPPNHPGFDVESRDASGEIVRYIEVKSSSGGWEWHAVGLSKEQFETATKLGDRYWLYVVERAKDPDYRIHRIRDPARRANEFFYDNGWAALSEGDGD